MELPKEEFEYRQKLANIGAQIALARGELATLGIKGEELIKLQEEGVLDRIKKALEASKDALKATKDNQDELLAYEQELTDFSEELHSWSDELDRQKQENEEKNAKTLSQIDSKLDDLKEITRKINIQSALIKKDKESLTTKEKMILDKERAVNDKYNTLLRTQERLKK